MVFESFVKATSNRKDNNNDVYRKEEVTINEASIRQY